MWVIQIQKKHCIFPPVADLALQTLSAQKQNTASALCSIVTHPQVMSGILRCVVRSDCDGSHVRWSSSIKWDGGTNRSGYDDFVTALVMPVLKRHVWLQRRACISFALKTPLVSPSLLPRSLVERVCYVTPHRQGIYNR